MNGVTPRRVHAASTSRRPGFRAVSRLPKVQVKAQAVSNVEADVGYLRQLREAAMALHTREQLGKQPKKSENDKTPTPRAEPTLIGYLRFLQESKLVWDCLEKTVADSDDPNLAPFKSTGLERGAALQKDIEWFRDTQALGPLSHKDDGPGSQYVELLTDLAENDVPAFLCHYYNVVFAHNAGGMMIGKSLSKKLLDGATLEFYKYDGDVKELGAVVKADLEQVAAQWTPEERQRSVDHTKFTFKYAGGLMKCITQATEE